VKQSTEPTVARFPKSGFRLPSFKLHSHEICELPYPLLWRWSRNYLFTCHRLEHRLLDAVKTPLPAVGQPKPHVPGSGDAVPEAPGETKIT
jgi:hypothetical protein